MWFKNLQPFRLPTPWAIDIAALDEQLARAPFSKCPSNQPMSRGWVSPRKDGAMAYSQNGQFLIALQIEQRILPSSVVNDEVNERAKSAAKATGRSEVFALVPVGAATRKRMNVIVFQELAA